MCTSIFDCTFSCLFFFCCLALSCIWIGPFQSVCSRILLLQPLTWPYTLVINNPVQTAKKTPAVSHYVNMQVVFLSLALNSSHRIEQVCLHRHPMGGTVTFAFSISNIYVNANMFDCLFCFWLIVSRQVSKSKNAHTHTHTRAHTHVHKHTCHPGSYAGFAYPVFSNRI